MKENERPVDWKIQAGVSSDIVRAQMPYLVGCKGEVQVASMQDGSFMISVGMNRYSSDDQIIYRYKPQTQTAELLSLDTNRSIQGVSGDSIMDRVDFSRYLQPEKAFEMLATIMGISAERVKGMFPEATNYDQILLNRTSGSSIIRITFNFPGSKPSSISCMYDYNMATGELEHTYKNDGKGKVWAKWNEKK